MAKKLVAPRMGEGVEEVTVVRWIKNEGDQVNEDDPVIEVETDKVAMEIPSPYSGVLLKAVAQPNQAVPVGEVLGWIGEPGEPLQETAGKATPAKVEKAPPAQAAEKSVAPVAETKPAPFEYKGFVSPLVRKLADENKVDLNLVKGTGEGGRITKQDILIFSQGKPEAAPLKAPSAAVKPASVLSEASFEIRPTLEGKLIPHSPMRKQIAERMVSSVRTSPHVLTVMEVDMSKVLAHHAANKPVYAAEGANLTLTAYFIKAIVISLLTYPVVNSSWTDEGLLIHPTINVGMAVALGDNGLIVPVIKKAEDLALLGIAHQVDDLAKRARSKKLLPDDVKDGTFSLTNYGIGGSLFAAPIIVQPQIGVLGTGKIQKRAVVVTDSNGSDAIAIRPMMYASFVFDHRVLDGEGADKFLSKFKETLENWI